MWIVWWTVLPFVQRLPKLAGCVLVAADARDPAVRDVQDHPATDAAVGADGLELDWTVVGGDAHDGSLRPARATGMPGSEPACGATGVAESARPPGAIHLPTQ